MQQGVIPALPGSSCGAHTHVRCTHVRACLGATRSPLRRLTCAAQPADGGTPAQPSARVPVNAGGDGTGSDPAQSNGQPYTSTLVAEAAAAHRRILWKQAIKPPMYSVGLVPVLVAAAAVFLLTGTVPAPRVLGFLVAATSIIAWLNLSNDAFDAATGVDASKPESVVNLTGNWSLVFWLSVAFLALGVGLLGYLISITGDMRVAGMLALSIACGYIYQGPPFRLSYKGLGEPLCFLAFGPSATPAFFLAMQPTTLKASAAAATAAAAAAAPAAKAAGKVKAATKAAAATKVATSAKAAAAGAAGAAAAGNGAAVGSGAAALPGVSSWLAGCMGQLQSLLQSVPPLVWGLSLLVGTSTTIILFTSHFHQIEGDTAAGKRSPLVRLGLERGVGVLHACVVGAYVLGATMVVCRVLPPMVLCSMLLLSLGPAKALLDYAVAHKAQPARLFLLKRLACMWHIALGLSIAVGLVVARLLAK